MTYKNFSLIYGFSIWLIATLLFRYFGTSFFIIDNGTVLTLLYLGIVALIYLLVILAFNYFKLSANEKIKSVVLMVIPGMLLDVICIKLHPIVFPDFSLNEVIVMSSWLLLAYTAALLSGLFLAKSKN